MGLLVGVVIPVAAPCRHWDRIESPKGPTSKARCKKCGRARV
ncbi:hypothetical protein LCGC14_2376460, partial [marine sediment metagenome]